MLPVLGISCNEDVVMASSTICVLLFLRVFVFTYVRACVYASVRARACVCLLVCLCVSVYSPSVGLIAFTGFFYHFIFPYLQRVFYLFFFFVFVFVFCFFA